MKRLRNNFREYVRTPFPYLFLAFSLFLGYSLVQNQSFNDALNNRPLAMYQEAYELCLLCSDPNATDAMSDIGFTVSNFILFPVNAVALGLSGTFDGVFQFSQGTVTLLYLGLSGIFGFFTPFAILMMGTLSLSGKPQEVNSIVR